VTEAQRIMLIANRDKLLASIRLVESSVDRTGRYDPEAAYTPLQREPFDALCDRFVRAVETAIRFFRSYEQFMQGISSDTLRDMLHGIEKSGLAGDAELWLDMRDVRNRIVHDYLPAQLAQLYADIRGPFFAELSRLSGAIEGLAFN